MNWYVKVLKQYADFGGRARRREYWFFILFNAIFGAVAIILDRIFGTVFEGQTFGIVATVYALALVVPSLAVEVRRLHDAGKSGWMIFLPLIPIIGAIWLFVLLVTNSKPGTNQWGPNPKGM